MAKELDQSEALISKAKDFWGLHGKKVVNIGLVLLLLIGGYWAYINYFKKPKEEKSIEALAMAEAYFRKDSFQLALNGDGVNLGFIKVADKFSGTKAGNLAKFYAGACCVKTNQNEKAIKFLNDFSTESKMIQARTYKLLGDAYADLGKGQEALTQYKKAAHHFEADKENSSEALFYAAYLSSRVLKNKQEAITLFKELKQKFPQTAFGYQADSYLAQLGEYHVD